MLCGPYVETDFRNQFVHLAIAVDPLGDEHGQTTGSKNPGELREDIVWSRCVVQAERSDDHVAHLGGQREGVKVAAKEVHVGASRFLDTLAGLREQGG
ncbi:hypothetical protein GCM10023224_15980 [Streptomonospora halophila]|uniref:Uncharacterized protein n=1 Tax=Streptomonospora halophila TaxID=427369 RepID=A0ABP9GAY0_9ACTN